VEQSTYLSVLARAAPEKVKAFVEDLIPELGAIDVLENRTGLVMLPMTEPVHGAAFYVGEVLVAEARVRVGGSEGYAACLGRDLEQALAIALLDAALVGGFKRFEILGFVDELAADQLQEDDQLLKLVEATRVEMETF
jgi:alpha-D-ribose 1-methylphosphonate 5-triphosphate synthase subunit PhnG